MSVEPKTAMPLARLRTRVGSYFVPLSLAWAVYIRNGLDKAPPEGVSISRAYWGLLATLLAGSALCATLALYIRGAKHRRGRPVLPPNTSFETQDKRNPVISRTTAIVFGLARAFGLVVFGGRYRHTQIHCSDSPIPLQPSFH